MWWNIEVFVESGQGRTAEKAETAEAGQERVPLTITPPSDKHRLDAEVVMGTRRKGIELKAIMRMQRGAAGCVAWNLATFSQGVGNISRVLGF